MEILFFLWFLLLNKAIKILSNRALLGTLIQLALKMFQDCIVVGIKCLLDNLLFKKSNLLLIQYCPRNWLVLEILNKILIWITAYYFLNIWLLFLSAFRSCYLLILCYTIRAFFHIVLFVDWIPASIATLGEHFPASK